MSLRRRLGTAGMILALVFILGALTLPITNKWALAQTKTQSVVMTMTSEETYTVNKDNYIQRTVSSQPAPEPDPLLAVKQAVTQVLTQHSGTYGVFFKDLQTGQTFNINGNESFPAASTFKIPLALYIYRNNLPLKNTIAYQDDFYEEGTGVLQTQGLKNGDRLDTKTLLALAIRESDNIAANMLVAEYGRGNVLAMERQLGGISLSTDSRNYTSPNDMGLFLQESLRYPNLLNDMELTVFNDRLPAGIPSGIPVAHKIGTFEEGVYHDVGIVFANHPFVLAVLSKGVNSEEEAAAVIAEVAKNCYTVEQ